MSADDPDAYDELEAAEFRAAADAAYAELLGRVGEVAPQPRLEPTRRAVELLGDVHRAAPVVHVTGTNGKTSTSRMIESLLRATGLRTGLLTSPHLERVTERIMIDGVPISDEAFARNWDDIRPYLLMVDAELAADGEETLTFFEALTVLAFASFADAPVDVVVLEVGMGGEWDSTNVADGQVAVFTPIALDHTQRLGSTVAEIARTKAGIIKPAATVVTAIQPIEALDELRAAAAIDEATLEIERVDFALESTTVAVGGQLVDIRGRAGRYTSVFLPLYGDHQAQNAAVAVAAVESFLGDGTVALDPDVVAEGFGQVASPGRLQLVGVEPTVLVDAAHNPHGAAALAAALQEYFDFDEFGFVLGVLADKDAHGIVAELAATASRVDVTQSSSDRAVDAEELAELVRDDVEPDAVFVHHELADAVEAARVWASESPRRAVVVTGSITLVGDVIALARDGGWK
ncbi:bifunctional folylpolyglutamate synthase/dihydrofolate synthase [Protaetiibacter intestinalis]|uniref:tetrahydrofolate synthase n=1 Tax=Protaetiibacter intestinalis TaxID=2419774 RepID=A0A387B6Z4_9MICO|nr:folylpolyglutamate synthase/dihydrofolate synthase family protein [Protaetiibacter intestinalis]AYF96965.1 bifunctional folylpolyglutamate synthase/dihydrofolate synthase [Protaetiibacter intestinalis]